MNGESGMPMSSTDECSRQGGNQGESIISTAKGLEASVLSHGLGLWSGVISIRVSNNENFLSRVCFDFGESALG